MTLSKTFSVSRQDEVSNWEICDMYPFTYEAELPSTGSMDITVLHIVQHKHKQTSRQKVAFVHLSGACVSTNRSRFLAGSERKSEQTALQEKGGRALSYILLVRALLRSFHENGGAISGHGRRPRRVVSAFYFLTSLPHRCLIVHSAVCGRM